MEQKEVKEQNPARKTAFQFILIFGVVSLFGDITYEGARAITGPYLAVLGASAAAVGLIAGLGEFLGYALRLASGHLADRTKAYWPITFIGYGLILSIPMLGLAGGWKIAAVLIVLERIGKAVRSPARDAILSHATKQVGRGLGFGLHEALDQVGAFIGPLIFTAVFLLHGDYRQGFTILWIPAVLVIIFLACARLKVKNPERLEEPSPQAGPSDGKLPRAFWLYLVFTSLTVAGFANFQLMSYHFKVHGVVPEFQIPIFYAVAMAVDAIVALAAGKAYDKIGLNSLLIIPILTVPIPMLAFSANYASAVAGTVMWGAVMGIHETTMRAAIADFSPTGRRGFAYGVFNASYGFAWLLGSTVMGFLHDFSLSSIYVFVIAAEAVAVPVFFMVRKEIKTPRRQ